MRARRFVSITIAAAVMSLILGGCQVRTTTDTVGAGTQKITKPQVTTVKVDRRDIVGYRILMGGLYIPAAAQADVMGIASLPVETVQVTKGEHVARGETLVDLATPTDDANYTQAKTTYEAAKTAYQSALAQYEQPVRDARRVLEQAQSTERTIRKATLPGGDATELQQAVANRHAAEDALKVAQANARANELPYKTQLDQARAAYEEASKGRQQSRITAPISGTVVSINAQPGQTLSAQAPFARIVDLDALAVKAKVSPDDAGFVKERTPVVVMFNDFPDRVFKGRVRSVQSLPAGEDGKTQYEATIDFTNVERIVTPEATVRQVGVEMGRRNNVIAVPVDAVAKDSTGKPIVNVMENGNWKPVVVELGMTDGNFVEVKSGVKEGDSVQTVTGQGQWIFTTNLTTK